MVVLFLTLTSPSSRVTEESPSGGGDELAPLRESLALMGYLSPPRPPLPGRFLLTAYCTCEVCTAPFSDGFTSTGARATEGRTIAVDPLYIPIGTWVEIEGLGKRRAEDIGGAIKQQRIDVFIDDHRRARQFGVRRSWTRRVGGG